MSCQPHVWLCSQCYTELHAIDIHCRCCGAHRIDALSLVRREAGKRRLRPIHTGPKALTLN